jgi:hypothetical protein
VEHSITRRDDSNDYIDSLAWTEDNVVQTNDLVAQRFLLEYRRARYSKYLVPPPVSLFAEIHPCLDEFVNHTKTTGLHLYIYQYLHSQ